MSEYERFMAWIVRTYPTHARAYSGDPVIQSAFFAGLAEDRRMRFLEARDGRSKDGGLEMALAQAAAMIERQKHVMQRAMDAWDTTTHQKNGDGRLWQCMEDLRGECGKQPNVKLCGERSESERTKG